MNKLASVLVAFFAAPVAFLYLVVMCVVTGTVKLFRAARRLR